MNRINLQPTGDQVRAFRDRENWRTHIMLPTKNLPKLNTKINGQQILLVTSHGLYGAGFEEIMAPLERRLFTRGNVRLPHRLWRRRLGFRCANQIPISRRNAGHVSERIIPKGQIHREAALEGQLLSAAWI